MKKILKVMAGAGLMAGLVIVGGCGSNDTAIVYPLSNDVQVAGNDSDNAKTGKYIYHVSPGNYVYSICDFGTEDQLVYPVGSDLSMNNTSFSDTEARIEWTTTSGTAVVKLTCLSNEEDGALLVPDDLNTVFGPGTLTR